MAAVPIAVAAGSALSGLFQGKGASDAAETTARAAEEVARIEAGTAANTLEFQKQQAAQDLLNANVASYGNYKLAAAREGYMNSLRTRIGAPAVQMPAFTPYVTAPSTTNYANFTPAYTGVQTGPTGGGTGAAPPVENQPTVYATNFAAAMTPQSGQGPMVTMKSPNGQTQQVPSSAVAHYQSLGAQVVG